MRRLAASVRLAGRRNVTGRTVGAGAEEMLLHLAHKIIPSFLVGKVEPVLIHQHLLMLQPLPPGLLRYLLENALAQLAWIGREIKAFRLAAQLDALYHPGHG